jgi:ABC-type antimicrobial peptide transport system permease subunit
MVLGESMGITLIGALVGVPLVLLSRAMTAQLLPEVSAGPASGVVAGLFMLFAVAAVTPAKRATQVDAMQCLRHE